MVISHMGSKPFVIIFGVLSCAHILVIICCTHPVIPGATERDRSVIFQSGPCHQLPYGSMWVSSRVYCRLGLGDRHGCMLYLLFAVCFMSSGLWMALSPVASINKTAGYIIYIYAHSAAGLSRDFGTPTVCTDFNGVYYLVQVHDRKSWWCSPAPARRSQSQGVFGPD